MQKTNERKYVFEIICHAIAIFDKRSAHVLCFVMCLSMFSENRQKGKRCTIPILLFDKHLYELIWIIHTKQTNNQSKTEAFTRRHTHRVIRRACKERGSKCFIVCHSPITYVAIYLDKNKCVSCSLCCKACDNFMWFAVFFFIRFVSLLNTAHA